MSIGILDIGVHLPSDVRSNSWWNAEVVAGWSARRRQPPPLAHDVSETGRQILAAMRAQAPDPFQGSSLRHVISRDASSTDIEAIAARDAITRANISIDEIDLLLTHTVAPQFWLTNSAAKLHHALGLRPECFALQVESAAYSFLSQLEIAHAMIASGRARTALLVQSSAATRMIDADDPDAPYFGDGATAVLIGNVSTRGIRSSIHYTDGRYPNTVVAGVPGGQWFEGRSTIHVSDPVGLRDVLLQTVDLCKLSVDAVLERSSLHAADVRLFCIHQGTAWLRRIAQTACGLEHAATIDTFPTTGYLFSSIIPLQLRAATDSQLVSRGDQVLLFGGGTGMTYGATVIEWGR